MLTPRRTSRLPNQDGVAPVVDCFPWRKRYCRSRDRRDRDERLIVVVAAAIDAVADELIHAFASLASVEVLQSGPPPASVQPFSGSKRPHHLSWKR